MRQHQIEHHQVGRAAPYAIERLGTVRRLLDREAILLEVVAKQFANIAFVLDDEDLVANTLAHLFGSLRHMSFFLSMCLMFRPLTM